jgi:hypothetical protein
MVLEGVPDIPERAARRVLGRRHHRLPTCTCPYHRSKGLVLYPHFIDRIVPGWLDKGMPWRHARGEWLDNVILVSPSRDYVAKLPHGKLPDRRDFARFTGDDAARMKYWRTAIGESARLGDEFLEFARRRIRRASCRSSSRRATRSAAAPRRSSRGAPPVRRAAQRLRFAEASRRFGRVAAGRRGSRPR